MKNFLTFLCFCIAFGSLLCTLAQNPGIAHSPAILTFTAEGCQFAKSLSLETRQDITGCTAIARFDPYRFGGGGSIRLDDDRVIRISDSSLLAWQPAPDDTVQDTPAQKGAMLRFWIFMLLTLLFTAISMRLAFGNSVKPSQNYPVR